MLFFTLTSAVALSSLLVSAIAAPQKRVTNKPLGQIYAYGTNITGFPVFVSDGIAYIGNVSLATAAGAANITCELPRFLPSADVRPPLTSRQSKRLAPRF